MKCSFLIANYNAEQELLGCLQAIYSSVEKDFEVIVADNGSMDDSVLKIKQQFPSVQVISLRENKGVPYALNLAAKQAQGEFLAVVHADTRVTPEWLGNAVAGMDGYPNVVAAATRVLKSDTVIDSAGYGYAQTGYPYKIASGKDRKKAEKAKRVMAPSNAAALYRREIFESLGGFAESFFYKLEDAEFGLRAAMHGYDTVYCPEAVAYHSGFSVSGGKESDFSLRFKARNTIYIRRRNLTKWMRFKYAWHLSRGQKRLLRKSRRKGMELACKQGFDEARDTVKFCEKAYKGCKLFRKKKIGRRMFCGLFQRKSWE